MAATGSDSFLKGLAVRKNEEIKQNTSSLVHNAKPRNGTVHWMFLENVLLI